MPDREHLGEQGGTETRFIACRQAVEIHLGMREGGDPIPVPWFVADMLEVA